MIYLQDQKHKRLGIKLLYGFVKKNFLLSLGILGYFILIIFGNTKKIMMWFFLLCCRNIFQKFIHFLYGILFFRISNYYLEIFFAFAAYPLAFFFSPSKRKQICWFFLVNRFVNREWETISNNNMNIEHMKLKNETKK